MLELAYLLTVEISKGEFNEDGTDLLVQDSSIRTAISAASLRLTSELSSALPLEQCRYSDIILCCTQDSQTGVLFFLPLMNMPSEAHSISCIP
jgi:hypothetical protein